MSETPRQDGQEDILERIISQGLKKAEAPPQDDAPPAPAGTETAPPAKRKAPRSPVYIYLLVLFGAAFLLLLLAYFVQQRNSANAISDLRNSMNLSRAELMEEIDGLKAEKESLEQEKAALEKDKRWAEADRQELEEKNQQIKEATDKLQQAYDSILHRTALDNGLDWLEQFNRTGDWLMSATIVESLDRFFNEKHPDYDSQYTLPAQAERYLKLRETVFDRGGCMVVEGWSDEPGVSDYTERPRIHEDTFDPLDLAAAEDLLALLMYYPVEPDFTASFAAEYLQPDGNVMARLKAGAFKRSTLELAEQARDDLIQGGWVTQDGDGKLTAPIPWK